MSELSEEHVVTIRPAEYLQQGLTHCGAYSVKAILSAYGVDDSTDPCDLYVSRWARILGIGIGRDYWGQVFRAHGIDVQNKSAVECNDTEKIFLLKRLLTQNTPVMIRIGNGYATDKYNPLLGRIIGHWITLWGYDGEAFYVYDSGLRRKFWNPSLPIGNTIRTSEEILRDWKFGKLQAWYWPFSGRENYQYFSVSSRY